MPAIDFHRPRGLARRLPAAKSWHQRLEHRAAFVACWSCKELASYGDDTGCAFCQDHSQLTYDLELEDEEAAVLVAWARTNQWRAAWARDFLLCERQAEGGDASRLACL